MSLLEKLETKLGVAFQNQDLLQQALVHRSYLNENPGFRLDHNERLEFLGDAVLELVVTEILYAEFPDKPEGELTNLRAALVNANMLSDVARDLGFNDHLLLSRGEAKDEGRARQYILANAFEAVVGALYLDQGYRVAHDFIERTLIGHLPRIVEQHLYRDPKSRFQEAAQEKAGSTPTYEVLEQWGPDHAKHFVVGVFVGRELVAKGDGPSKQAGEEAAAKAGLEVKGW